MGDEGKITIQINQRGELIYIDINGRTLTEPTHNLYDNIPGGVLKGIIEIGQIYCYEQPNGTVRRCVHMPNCDIYCF
jgi:hypothetical protein